MNINVELEQQVLLGFFLFCLAIQAVYYLFIFSKLFFYKNKNGYSNDNPVSVIICARNELKNLKNHLHLFLEQDYPNFQVIVVNDCSWDESEKFLEECEAKYSNLKVVTLLEQERYRHGKKFALSIGIKAAEHEILLLTDADCRPASKNWLREMTKNIGGAKEIVIGYGGYEKAPGILNKWIRLDTVFNAMQYLSCAIGKNTYMGTGRNLCYKKSLFFKNKGFASHSHIASGDDDLFINQTATAVNTVVEISPEAFTYSKPKENFSGWLTQKRRHMSTGKSYKPKHQFMLGLFYFSQIFFYLSLIILLIFRIQLKVILAAYVLRLIIQLIVAGKSAHRLKEADVIWLLPFFDFLLILIYPILATSNLFIKNNKTWK